jgi:capsular polysaccharide biosynthesis protein
VNEAENNNHSGTLSATTSDDLRERLWAYEDLSTGQEHPPFNIAGSFASLGFIGMAVRRSKRMWGAVAVLGMIVGLALFVKYPVSYQATTSILIKDDPTQDPVSAMQTDITLAESRSVAANTLKALGLTQSVSSFQAAYSATIVTNQVLTLTVSAPTDTGAMQRANELASQFLAFRASLLRVQQAQQLASLGQQVPAAQQHIASLQQQVSQMSGESSRLTRLTKLRNELTTAQNSLPTLEQTVISLKSTTQNTTADMIYGSQVLDRATLLHHSKVKDVVEYVLSGLVGGLAVGLGIVVVRELISDRLRRRDDIAAAIGAPVRLSVGPAGAGRLPVSPRTRRARERDTRRVSGYLRNVLPKRPGSTAALAIVAVDNTRMLAPALTSLAESCASDGMRVVVADLTEGAPVARLLGADGPGTRPVRVGDTQLITVIPGADDVVPSGPFRPSGPLPQATPPDESLVVASRTADLVLTVTELDPGTGAEHLATWAADAVVLVTAGHTRSARVYAVGEMLRLSGVHVVSGVVVGADRTDQSLGIPPGPEDARLNGGNAGVVLR